jgi:hypothetical protein
VSWPHPLSSPASGSFSIGRSPAARATWAEPYFAESRRSHIWWTACCRSGWPTPLSYALRPSCSPSSLPRPRRALSTCNRTSRRRAATWSTKAPLRTVSSAQAPAPTPSCRPSAPTTATAGAVSPAFRSPFRRSFSGFRLRHHARVQRLQHRLRHLHLLARSRAKAEEGFEEDFVVPFSHPLSAHS